MTRILITGSRGQLGSTLKRLLSERTDIDARFTCSAELNVAIPLDWERSLSDFKPDFIINCAAYTAVDKAEDHETEALMINCEAVRIMADAAARHGCKIIHISTDYVFDGDSHIPLREKDATSPLTAYGRTKLAGEESLMRILPHGSVILRTAWLYSPYGHNFVKTMLRLSSEHKNINVVADQIGSPTSALTLARAIMTVIDHPQWHPGIYHVTDAGVASWYDLAVATMHMAGKDCHVTPITTAQYPTPARRPYYSLLAKEKFTSTFGITLPHWQESLRICLEELLKC